MATTYYQGKLFLNSTFLNKGYLPEIVCFLCSPGSKLIPSTPLQYHYVLWIKLIAKTCQPHRGRSHYTDMWLRKLSNNRLPTDSSSQTRGYIIYKKKTKFTQAFGFLFYFYQDCDYTIVAGFKFKKPPVLCYHPIIYCF